MKLLNRNILCVDDISENLYAYEIILSKLENVTVLKAESGADALKMVLRKKIDLILLDIQMPQMDGYEVATFLKSNHATRNIPIIFITAIFKQEEFIAKGFSLGAVDYMTKPLDDNLLINRIKLYLDVFTQKENAENTLQMFYDITQGIGDGLYVLNSNGTLDFINDVALQMLGYSWDELESRPIHDVIHRYDRTGARVMAKDCPIHRVFHDQKIRRIDEDVLLRKDGTFLSVSTIATPIIKNGIAKQVVTLFRDISKEIQLKSLQEKNLSSKSQMIYMMIDAIEKRDPYTSGHTRRVAEYCELIAKEMKYPQDQIDLLVNAAHLHDIGKITTPDSILLKPGHFNADEYSIMKLHLDYGYELISNIEEYREIAEVMRYHHERFDGKGYPLGISADEIPPLSRIMILADAFDAITTNRIYKKRKNINEALEEIQKLSGIQFHPEIVQVAIKAFASVTIGDHLDQRPHNLLEEKRFAYFYLDRLSGFYHIDYLLIVLEEYYPNQELVLYKLSIHNMGHYNIKHSWEEGDHLLADFSKILHQQCLERFVFRIHGDDFLIVSENKTPVDIALLNEYLSSFDSELYVDESSLYINTANISFEDVIKQI